MSSYSSMKLKLAAVIDGRVTYDLIQCGMTYALNEIPTASLGLAVGRHAQTGRRADVHGLFDNLEADSVVEVFLTVLEGDSHNAEAGVPLNRAVKIFEGHPVGRGWTRTNDSAMFTLPLVHWLGDLHYGSAVSASSHPGNPANLTYPALFQAVGTGDETNVNFPNEPTWIPMISKSLVNAANLQDIWGKIFWPWFNALASQDAFDAALVGVNRGGKSEVQEALQRLKPHPDGKPLALDVLDGDDNQFVAEGIRNALRREAGGNWINTTLWGKLIGDLAPAYWFSVVPRPDDALVIPFTGGLQGDPWRVLHARDHAFVRLDRQLNQILRAVGIVHPVGSFTGMDMNSGSVPLNFGGTAGWFQPDNINTGLVLLKDAPKWLADATLADLTAVDSTGIDGVTGTSVDAVGVATNTPDRQIAIYKKFRPLMNAYARQWYILESLKGSMGELSGKLRLDVAPGSNIQVEAGKSLNVEDDEITEDIFATVVKTSILLDAQHSRAGTSYSLSHIRSKAENEATGTSIDKPPLYKEAWVGASLI